MSRATDSAAAALQTHRQELIAFAAAMVGSDRAEDVVQDAYFRLSRALERQTVENPRAYLYRITANLARDLLRRDKRADRHLKSIQPEVHAPAAGEVAALDQQLEILRAAIGELPPKCRRAFVARKYEGLSYREIAARDGITEKTVENHIGRAIKLLRDALDKKLQ